MPLSALFLSLILSLVPHQAAAQRAPLRLDLNIPAGRLVVYEGDAPLRSYPVSVGKLGHDTPTGEFSISHAEWNPWWRPPAREWARDEKPAPPGPNNPMGRVKLFFETLYFIHGTPEKASIGTPASHGCVRMLNEDVIALSRLLHERAAPQVTGAEITRILARPTETRRVNFRSSVPLVIRYDPVEVVKGEVRVYPDVYKRNAIHSEGVYQALLGAGYDLSTVPHDAVRRFVDRARRSKGGFTVSVREAFGSDLAMAQSAVATP